MALQQGRQNSAGEGPFKLVRGDRTVHPWLEGMMSDELKRVEV